MEAYGDPALCSPVELSPPYPPYGSACNRMATADCSGA